MGSMQTFQEGFFLVVVGVGEGGYGGGSFPLGKVHFYEKGTGFPSIIKKTIRN